MSKYFKTKNQNKIITNYQIKFDTLRVVDSDKTALGIMEKEDAIALAKSQNLDLVLIVPKAKPPVCKIMDFGKYKYEEKKKAQQARKNHHVIKVKELRMRPNIGDHDLENKLKMGKKFLSEGCKLKLSIMYRGREMSRQDLGDALLEKVVLNLSEVAELEKDSPMMGRKKSIILAPKRVL